MKRFVDVVVAIAALTAFLPFGILIVVLLRLTGEGLVLYRQTRIGREQHTFDIFKFVTMLKDSPNLGAKSVTVENDPRVLPVGRFLRYTKLNEFPQFWNVLRGDMSLVGPRPLTPGTFAYYDEEAQDCIAKVRPGITGVGSVIFRDEEKLLSSSLKNPEDFYRSQIAPYKAALEIWYIHNRSCFLDLKLLCFTMLALFFPSPEFFLQRLPALPAFTGDRQHRDFFRSHGGAKRADCGAETRGPVTR